MVKTHPTQSTAAISHAELESASAVADHVSHTIDTITEIYARAEKSVDPPQRAIETFTGMLGRPVSLYLILIIVGAWVIDNLTESHYHVPPWDTPPFYWLQGVIGLSALLTTIVVLITQNRMSKMAESRARLDLQINLLIEQKVAKMIELMEELRTDLPSVRNRDDPTADAMAQSADPNALLEATEIQMEKAVMDDKAAIAEKGKRNGAG